MEPVAEIVSDSGIEVTDDDTIASTLEEFATTKVYTREVEFKEPISIEESSPPNPELEDDDDFVDVEGVVTQEQAKETIDEILTAPA